MRAYTIVRRILISIAACLIVTDNLVFRLLRRTLAVTSVVAFPDQESRNQKRTPKSRRPITKSSRKPLW